MKQFLSPLGIFFGGQVLLLFFVLFMPAIGSASTELAADTAAYADTFWGWTWAVGSTKLFIFLVVELLICIATGKALLGLKR